MPTHAFDALVLAAGVFAAAVVIRIFVDLLESFRTIEDRGEPESRIVWDAYTRAQEEQARRVQSRIVSMAERKRRDADVFDAVKRGQKGDAA